MNFSYREFLIQGISSTLYEFILPPGQGIYPTLYEFLIQGIYPTLIWISDSGNFWFREFLIQGISDSGNFWFREFLIQGIYPPSGSGNVSLMEIIIPYMNFSSHPGREFLIPSGQGISHPIRAGNFSSSPGREFIIHGIYHTLYEFLLPYGQGIYHPLRAWNLSLREFIIPYMNFSSLREFIISSMNLSFREFLFPPPGEGGIYPWGNFPSMNFSPLGVREFPWRPDPEGEKFLTAIPYFFSPEAKKQSRRLFWRPLREGLAAGRREFLFQKTHHELCLHVIKWFWKTDFKLDLVKRYVKNKIMWGHDPEGGLGGSNPSASPEGDIELCQTPHPDVIGRPEELHGRRGGPVKLPHF